MKRKVFLIGIVTLIVLTTTSFILFKVCPTCLGDGVIKEKCSACSGSGQIEYVEQRVLIAKEKCDNCGGDGIYNARGCDYCGGSGEKYIYSDKKQLKPCGNCYGAGYNKKLCNTCSGKGKVE